jgi:mono/diheme cytochrome c family protein
VNGGKRVAIAAMVLCAGIALTAVALEPMPLEAMDGRQIYERICQGCHMADGRGAVGAGHYPALAKDPTLASRQYMALTLLTGRRNMPAFGEKHAIGFGGPAVTLTDAQIAAVTNYVRTNFGNQYSDSITAAEVAALDQKTR